MKFVRVTKDVRLKREAAAMRRLRHENVCVCHGYHIWEDRSLGCILLEKLRGGTLACHIAPGSGTALCEREVLDMTAQVLGALGAMHQDSARLVHRDVKPGNIMATQPRKPGARAGRTQWKLIDFGTAVAARSEGDAAHVSSTLETCSNSWTKLQGTVPFMAPEVVERSEEVDHRADLWSLGVTMFQCFSEEGVLPFAPGKHAEGIIWAARHARASPSPLCVRLSARYLPPSSSPPAFALKWFVVQSLPCNAHTTYARHQAQDLTLRYRHDNMASFF